MPPSRVAHRVALLVMVVDGEMTLCPFFAKCDGVLVIDPESTECTFLPKTRRTTEAMCDLILETGADRLILGFIPGPAVRKLRAAGIDIRLGSCACATEELAACFDHLPAA
jgi:predicted Fe-Mo cluster-binding NifX family protein